MLTTAEVFRVPRGFRLSWVVFAAAGLMAAPAETDPITVVAKEERRVQLSVAADDQTFPGSYRVDVFLPPGYFARTEAYRVLYAFDGSDLRPEHDDLLGEGLIYPAILVAIQNRTARSRVYDLTPYPAARSRVSSGGGLAAFGKLIANRIKPYVDGHFRTLPDAAHTGVVGNYLCWVEGCFVL